MKIALLGYGKMGKEIEQIAQERNHEIILIIDSKNASELHENTLGKADVAIDFSIPGSAVNNILKCFDANVPVVVGTTGWGEHLEEIKKQCNERGQTLFYASNFSIGVNLFFQLNEHLAKIMKDYNDYNPSIEEVHHVHKLDAPSGTAITLADEIIQINPRKDKWVNENTEEENELEIASTRSGEIPGIHIVKYSSDIDEIEIAHVAHNRKGFAKGAVLAAEWIKGKKGVFGMKDLIANKTTV